MDSNGPRKLYYSISEVSGITGVKPHILRFWEKEFSVLRPRKNRAGNRSYRERDIRVALAIKRLLYEEKYTVKGASERLRRDRSLVDEMDLEAGVAAESAVVIPAAGPSPGLSRPIDPVQPGDAPPPSSQAAPSRPRPALDPLMRTLLNDLRRDLTGLLEIIDGQE